MSHNNRGGGLFQSKFKVWVMYGVFAALTVLSSGYLLRTYYLTLEANAIEHASNDSFMIAEWLKSSFRESGYVLLDIDGHLSDVEFRNASVHPERTSLLFQKLQTVPSATFIALFDQNGRVFESTSPRIDNVAQFPFFEKARNATEEHSMGTTLFRTRDNTFWLGQVRNVMDSEGNFLGGILLGLSPEFFGNLMNQISVVEGGIISIFDENLHLISRNPSIPEAIGLQITDSTLIEVVQEEKTHFVFRTHSPYDNLKRVYSARRLENLPIIVGYGIPDEVWLSDWKQTLWGSTALVAALLLIGILVLVNHFRVRNYVHEQEELYKKLRITNDRLEYLAKHTRSVTSSVDTSGLYTSMSDVSTEVFGYEPHELVGKKYFYDLHPEEGRELFKNEALKAFGDKEVFTDYLNPIQRKDGTTIWVSTNAFPLLDKEGNLVGYYGTDMDVTERLAKEATTQNLIKEKDIILREVHHRVKNNMATIHSLLTLQSYNHEGQIAEVLIEAAGRVNTMGTLYEILYRSGNTGFISAQSYIHSLLEKSESVYPRLKDVDIAFNITDVDLHIKTMSALGIIFNEMVTNAMKYAFKEHPNPRLKISLSVEGDRCKFIFQDNGPGFSSGSNSTEGFGMQLIQMLVDQLEGELETTSKSGVSYEIVFPKSN